jgi:hypothetical protein
VRPLRDWMRDPRIAGLLGGVALLLVGYRFYSTVAGTPAPNAKPAVSAAKEEGPAPAETLKKSPGPEAAVRTSPRPRVAIRWDWDRNPFLPSDSFRASAGAGDAAGSPEPKGLADLRGTVITRSSGIAIFGDRLVPAGGTIDGWTVVKVDPYTVSLRRGGETRQVEMFKPAP